MAFLMFLSPGLFVVISMWVYCHFKKFCILTIKTLFLGQLLGRKHCTKYQCTEGHPFWCQWKAVYQFLACTSCRISELRFPTWPRESTCTCRRSQCWWMMLIARWKPPGEAGPHIAQNPSKSWSTSHHTEANTEILGVKQATLRTP